MPYTEGVNPVETGSGRSVLNMAIDALNITLGQPSDYPEWSFGNAEGLVKEFTGRPL